MSKTAENIIKAEEGWKPRQYYCSEHYPTIGYGRKCGPQFAPLTNEITTKEKESQFIRDEIREIQSRIIAYFPKAWNNCNNARQAILISLVYQMGMSGVTKFTKMWQALSSGDFEWAAKEMLDSKWAKQTPNRAKRHSEQMRTGSIHMYYLSSGEI